MVVTPPHSACLSSSPSTTAPSPYASQPAAPLHVVRQALERALLQSNNDFWVENPTKPENMAKQCPKRRSIQAMQFFLRLHILVACQGMAASTVTPSVDCSNHAQHSYGAVYHVCYPGLITTLILHHCPRLHQSLPMASLMFVVSTLF